MPFARVTLSHALLPGTEANLCEALTTLIAEALAKRHDLTSVLIEVPGRLRWAVGNREQSMAAHLEVWVTAGTNSSEQKRDFLSKAMAVLRSALPGLHPASYIVVNEVPASDWGYGGISQADRAKGTAPA
ncbi:tautomerase family protein [Pseudomonas sp. DC3000-4b1]|uniref:tautomerase family protein n=1 Tax=unclassified Pseudomonas TaxID=196821 RepID=UPI003CF906FB